MSDALEEAKALLDAITQVKPTGYFKGGEKLPKEWSVTLIQLNTQIAIAERMERIAVVLEGAYNPNVEMLRVEAWNYDTRREVG